MKASAKRPKCKCKDNKNKDLYIYLPQDGDEVLYLGGGARELEPEVAADHEDESVDEHQVGEVLGVPVQGLLVAHLVDEAVLLQVQVRLQARHLLVGQQGHLLQLHLRPVGQRRRLVRSHGPLGETDDLILHDLGEEPPNGGGRTWREAQ